MKLFFDKFIKIKGLSKFDFHRICVKISEGRMKL